jgi:hypothetical protein
LIVVVSQKTWIGVKSIGRRIGWVLSNLHIGGRINCQEGNVREVVLTHLVPSIAPEEAQEKNFVKGMSDVYSGLIVVGRDNMIFTVD